MYMYEVMAFARELARSSSKEAAAGGQASQRKVLAVDASLDDLQAEELARKLRENFVAVELVAELSAC